jgi:signal peptidase II
LTLRKETRALSKAESLLAVWVTALVWLAADLASKTWALRVLAGAEREVIPGLLWFDLVRNPGAAFGLLPGGRPLFIALAVLLLGVGVWAPVVLDMRRLGLGHLGLGLLVGGGMGNLFDRVFRGGLVVDFIDFRFWPVFNIADIGIVVGTVLVAVFLASGLFRPRTDAA